jgi:LmbE family N-acetylglucosaminyl deacetylase
MPSLLCLIAHPDDETMLCGGTLARLAAQGVAVHLACLTRGEGGEMGEPPLVEREHLGEFRSRELACAAKALGIETLSYLDYLDPLVGPEDALFAPEHDPAVLQNQIMALLRETGASVLLTHGSNGEYGHPAHQLVHRAGLAAAVTLGAAAPIVYSFAAHYPEHQYPRLANADDPADLVVDVTPYLPQKEAAALCHATQVALFVRRRSEAAGRTLTVREIILTEESFHRHLPTQPPAVDPFRDWLTTP